MDFFETPRRQSTRRILALWFPRLATDRLQRRWKAALCDPSPEPPLPLVVAAKIDNAMRLTAVDRAELSSWLCRNDTAPESRPGVRPVVPRAAEPFFRA